MTKKLVRVKPRIMHSDLRREFPGYDPKRDVFVIDHIMVGGLRAAIRPFGRHGKKCYEIQLEALDFVRT